MMANRITRFARVAIAAALVVSCGVVASAAEPSFRLLDFSPTAVSADGTVVVGAGSGGAVLWRSDGNIVRLGVLPDQGSGDRSAYATGVSADGSVVVGVSGDRGSYSRGFRWTANSGMVGLDGMNWASDVSDDGSIVVGTRYAVFGGGGGWSDALRWTADGGTVALGAPAGYDHSDASAISADGSVVVGTTGTGWFEVDVAATRAWKPTVWNDGGKTVLLGGQTYWPSGASAVSADGSVVAGIDGGQAFRWTHATGMESLGALPGYELIHVSSVSGDGSMIVGECSRFDGTDFEREAFVWDAAHGMRSLRDVLRSHGIDTTAWFLATATAISADGTTIVGNEGYMGQYHGWIATIPEPAISSLAILLTLAASRATTRPARKAPSGQETSGTPRVVRRVASGFA